MSNSKSLHYKLCCEAAKYIIQPRAREPWQSQNILSTVELICYGTELTIGLAHSLENGVLLVLGVLLHDGLQGLEDLFNSLQEQLLLRPMLKVW